MTKVFMVIFAISLSLPLSAEDALPVNLANGIKVGELTTTSAIVWTHLTRHPERNISGLEWGEHEALPKGKRSGCHLSAPCCRRCRAVDGAVLNKEVITVRGKRKVCVLVINCEERCQTKACVLRA